jgi:hypothetical protein
MRMVERKQDALSKNFLLGLIDDEPKNEGELHIDVRKAPQIKSDQTLSHLTKRIVDEVRITTPRQRAQSVLKNAGLHTQPNATQVANSHLQHVGQRARKVSLNETPVRRIRRVKKQPESPQRRRTIRGPPQATRTRPSVGSENEIQRSARNQSNSTGKRRKLRSMFSR